MSMSLIVGEFTRKSESIIGAEYVELCKSIYLTEFIDGIISDFTEDLTVFEQVDETEYDKIIYKTISIENIKKLTNKIDDLTFDYFQKYGNLKGKTEKDVSVEHIRNLVDLNYIIRETLYNNLTNQTEEKLVILIIA